MEKIIVILSSKGTLIGFFAGIVKIMQSIRLGTFKWLIAMTDLVAGALVGYTTWELAMGVETLSSWQQYVLTIFASLNAFIIIGIITDKEFVKNKIEEWTGKK